MELGDFLEKTCPEKEKIREECINIYGKTQIYEPCTDIQITWFIKILPQYSQKLKFILILLFK
jgi:hypothetical protein